MLGQSSCLTTLWPLFSALISTLHVTKSYFEFCSIINLLTQSSENTDRLRNGPRRDSFSISFPSAFDNGDGIHRSVKVTIYVEIPQADHICEKITDAKNFTGQGVPLSLPYWGEVVYFTKIIILNYVLFPPSFCFLACIKCNISR